MWKWNAQSATCLYAIISTNSKWQDSSTEEGSTGRRTILPTHETTAIHTKNESLPQANVCCAKMGSCPMDKGMFEQIGLQMLELCVKMFSIVLKQCSVGCGKGYSTREVKCMLSGTKVNELMCRNQAKPIATQHCEITSDCKWKAGPWKPVNYPMEIRLLRFGTIFC